ncbi:MULTISPECIES: acyl carrier protein [Prevotellaceae]|uniref:Acyl carrier protein n=2 Tax=Prevotellaceae TaxID=171552 RepID=F9D1Z9_PREDD|nr:MULTISPECIES: acyl carrier protein [Prevotellaceae]AGB28346.1 acyl carrier protein [Prevotella dentalis DSM 3688]EGQ15817.1 acyl carrier protein [Prevotella dentalis DSM 3688]
MEREEVLTQLNEIFAEVFKRPGMQLDYAQSADDIDEWDSLTNMTLISEVEHRWGFKFKLHDIIKMRNVGDMVDCIVKRAK